MDLDSTPLTQFIRQYTAKAPHFMWLLGAGTSRSAGLPTATDIVWDLKQRYYCIQENQDLQSHDVSNRDIRQKIQSYMDSRGFPKLWSPEEYSFYFDLVFRDDYSQQQGYIEQAVASEKVSLNIGHRAFAGLLAMNLARVVFTTNFDGVLEKAYASTAGKNLTAFHLEGSYAALDALNKDQFPMYAKLHGDFRFQSIKNLTQDLQDNDLEIQKCFLAAATRFGLVVAGYSGRDKNVMSMLRSALDQNNAFPHGLWWTVPSLARVEPEAKQLLAYAKERGISSSLVEAGTFDEMLSKIWRQVEGKPSELDQNVRTTSVANVNIELSAPGSRYPILRTNAIPIIRLPIKCGCVEIDASVTRDTLVARAANNRPKLEWRLHDKLFFWGSEDELKNLLPKDSSTPARFCEFTDVLNVLSRSTVLRSFYNGALSRALCGGKPLVLRKKKGTFYVVVRHDASYESVFSGLRKAVGYRRREAAISGSVPGLTDVLWAESVATSLEERDGKLWLMLEPDIWIKPLDQRNSASDFIRQHKLKRYNAQANSLLNTWIEILLGVPLSSGSATVACYADTDFPAEFEIGTRSAFSGGGSNAK